VAVKRKRKLTRKQILAGFGGSRRRELAKPGPARRSRYAAAKRYVAVRSRSATRRSTRSTRTRAKSRSTGRPAWVTAATWAAIAAAAAVLGISANKWVQERGGWDALKAAYDTGGVAGALSFISASPTSPTAQTAALTPTQAQKLLASMPPTPIQTQTFWPADLPIAIGPPAFDRTGATILGPYGQGWRSQPEPQPLGVPGFATDVVFAGSGASANLYDPSYDPWAGM